MNQQSAGQIARELLRIKAVKLRPNEPFTWASGWKSPIYCDNRQTLAYPELRTLIKEELAAVVREKYPQANVIVGVATGAIAQGALVADLLQLPFAYVRPKPKDHGMGNTIEGQLLPGQKAVVIEDLISTGSSSLKAVESVRAAGVEVLGMVANFTYGFPQAEEAFDMADVHLDTLCNYHVVIEEALRTNYVTDGQMETLLEWRNNPSEWGI